jgi:hypothetical protein
VSRRLEVGVPSAELGYVLAQRLGGGAKVVPDSEDSHWCVALEEVWTSELLAVLPLVESWLRDQGLDRVEVRVGGRIYQLEAQEPLPQRLPPPFAPVRIRSRDGGPTAALELGRERVKLRPNPLAR